jgi:hypothetical protein
VKGFRLFSPAQTTPCHPLPHFHQQTAMVRFHQWNVIHLRLPQSVEEIKTLHDQTICDYKLHILGTNKEQSFRETNLLVLVS